MIDVTDVPDVRVGMEITVFGKGGASIDEYATANNTIPYEVMSILTARVPRVAEGGKSLA
jgi:alanine racemase